MLRKLNMGMVGGGRDAFVGGIHRMAARLDGEIELVAGAFSSDPEKAKRSGEDLFLDPKRVYSDYQRMAKNEADLPEESASILYRLSRQTTSISRLRRSFSKQGST